MTKTLLKKQFKELYAAYFRSGNSKKKNSKALPVVYALLMLYVAGFLFFFFICGRVVLGMRSQGSSGLEYVVVLGAQVKGEVPSKALYKRLVKALEYAKENEDTVLILSGGQGTGENITEAECMRRWLTE